LSPKRGLRPSSSKTWQPSPERDRWLANTPFVAYVAGLVDGEGCLSLIERTNGECKRRSFSFRLAVEMGDKAEKLLTLCHQRLGGTLQKRNSRNQRHQGRTVWNTHTREALPLLEAMLPHMIVKQEQARLCITACRLILGKPENFERDLGIIKGLMHELNKTGPQQKLATGWFARLVDGNWLSPQSDMFEPAGLAMFSGPWPEAGIMRNGAVYPPPKSVRRTSGTGSGSLPTPQASDSRDRGDISNPSIQRRMRLGKQTHLSHRFKGTPCPTCVEGMMGFPRDWLKTD
jgi:hypothetical protein